MDTLIRFPNEATYHTIVSIELDELTDIEKFHNDVFATWKGTRIAIWRKHYDAMVETTNKD